MKEDSAHELTPFGNPDGSRANLDQITRGFVDFGSASAWGGLSTPSNDLGARVLVGRKGSGKTLYLRRLQAHSSQDRSLYADPIQQDLPTTESIVKFCQWFPKTTLNEQWMELWRKAIMLSLSSHILCNRHLKESVTSDARARIKTSFGEIVRDFSAAVSVYSQLKEIIGSHHSRTAIERYLNNALWSELEVVVAEILADCPPICLYIDAVDEEFESAPMYWLRCQKGLFYETMRLLRDAHFGNRLHVITCIRDIVLSSVNRSEHQTRYKGESHIRVLNWNRKSIEYFLSAKLKQVHPSFFVREAKEGNLVQDWLGTDSVANESRGCDEPVITYLLRHTRLLPRDIVIMGNLLSRAIAEIKPSAAPDQLQAAIRYAVAEGARSFGNEQIAICANEMVSSAMPANAVHQRYAETYVGNKEYAANLSDDLKKLVSSAGTDRFSNKTLDRMRHRSEEIFGKDADPLSILWRNGLIGYTDGPRNAEKHVFYSDDRMDEFSLPLNMRTYVYHPVIIDAVGVRASGNKPVLPFNAGR